MWAELYIGRLFLCPSKINFKEKKIEFTSHYQELSISNNKTFVAKNSLNFSFSQTFHFRPMPIQNCHCKSKYYENAFNMHIKTYWLLSTLYVSSALFQNRSLKKKKSEYEPISLYTKYASDRSQKNAYWPLLLVYWASYVSQSFEAALV